MTEVMTESKERQITVGGKDYVPRTATLYADVFREDPIITYMLSSLSNEKRLEYVGTYLHALIKAASLNDANFQEIDDFSCAAIWLPPGKRMDRLSTSFQAGLVGSVLKLGFSGYKRMVVDFQDQSMAVKKEALKGTKKFHYLFFIGTDVSARGRGLASKLITAYQEKTASDGLPMYLEASSWRSRDLYLRLGFEVVREIRLGKGTHAATGLREEGGEGVGIWPMVWWPAQKR